MPKLELTWPEADLLHEIVEEWLSDLQTEIGHTDNLDYRERLKRQEALLRGILDRLGAPVTASSQERSPPGPARRAGPGSRS